jgi:hypothetical protein
MTKRVTRAERRALLERNIRIHRLYPFSQHFEKPIQELISENELEKICKYLKNPISSGLWNLEAIWLPITKGITNEIIEDLKTTELKDDFSDDKKRDEFLDIINRLTFSFRLFSFMCWDEERIKNYLGEEEFILIRLLNIEKYKKKYLKELEYYKDHLYVDNYLQRISSEKFNLFKEGIMRIGDVINKRTGEKIINILSLDPDVLELAGTFFKSIGKITDFTIRPIYSPEEEVFESYFLLFEIGYQNFIKKGKIHSWVNTSISSYNDKNYPYCISIIGLILEEQLTQIYETMFRKKCPQRSTLGEMYNLIGEEIENKFPEKEVERYIDMNELYKKINELIKNKVDSLINIDILSILRDILTLIKENNKEIMLKIKKSQNTDTYSIFPSNIKENIYELIKYRNAISHRSQIPIGSYEATKSIYSITSLIMWWKEENENLDWRKDPDNIIIQLLKRNNPNFKIEV